MPRQVRSFMRSIGHATRYRQRHCHAQPHWYSDRLSRFFDFKVYEIFLGYDTISKPWIRSRSKPCFWISAPKTTKKSPARAIHISRKGGKEPADWSRPRSFGGVFGLKTQLTSGREADSGHSQPMLIFFVYVFEILLRWMMAAAVAGANMTLSPKARANGATEFEDYRPGLFFQVFSARRGHKPRPAIAMVAVCNPLMFVVSFIFFARAFNNSGEIDAITRAPSRSL